MAQLPKPGAWYSSQYQKTQTNLPTTASINADVKPCPAPTAARHKWVRHFTSSTYYPMLMASVFSDSAARALFTFGLAVLNLSCVLFTVGEGPVYMWLGCPTISLGLVYIWQASRLLLAWLRYI